MTDELKPREIIKIRYCAKCGRTDETFALKPRHFAKGTLCLGEIKTAVYRLSETEGEGDD